MNDSLLEIFSAKMGTNVTSTNKLKIWGICFKSVELSDCVNAVSLGSRSNKMS